jgi:ankyrin repeat protein
MVASGYIGDVLPNGGRPQQRVEMPAVQDWGSLEITLQRGICGGGVCPAYEVTIRGDGTVTFVGESGVAVLGRHSTQIPVQAVRDLFERFRNAEFFWLYDGYQVAISHHSNYSLTVSYDGHRKQVLDYAGRNFGMPAVVTALQDAVDEVADSEKWVKFTPRTLPALRAENWDFKAQSRANRSLIGTLIEQGADAFVVRDLISLGVPVNGRIYDDSDQTALTRTASKGDVAAARALMDAGAARGDRDQQGRALFEALRNGRLEMMRLLLARGADPHYRDADGSTTLHAAVESTGPALSNRRMVDELLKLRPDINATNQNGETALIKQVDLYDSDEFITAMLVKAGADVNARDDHGNTALINATSNLQQVAVLLEAGADVNARNEDGETALMICFTAEIAYRLLSHGADYSIRNRGGQTALEIARTRYKAEAKAIVLERWIAEHPSTANPSR